MSLGTGLKLEAVQGCGLIEEGQGRVGVPEDLTGRFYERIFVGRGTVNILGHLGPSGFLLWKKMFKLLWLKLPI
jgi:hypothetical protein